MPTDKNWIREYELKFVSPTDSVLITSIAQKVPLSINFKIAYDPTNTSGQGLMDLSIFGLKESSIGILSGENVKVYFTVGYRVREGNSDNATLPSDLDLIFSGDVFQSQILVKSGTFETKLKCRASKIGSKLLMKTYENSGTHKDRIVQMLRDAVVKTPSLKIDQALSALDRLETDEPTKSEAAKLAKNEEGIPLLSDPVVGTYTASKTVFEELRSYCKTFAINIAIISNSVYLVRDNGRIPTGSSVRAELGKNLLIPPTRVVEATEGPVGSKTTKYRYKLKMLLSPQIDLNTGLISNVVRNTTGTVDYKDIALKPVKITHTGQFRGNAWYTEVEATEDTEWYKSSPIASTEADFYNPTEEP